jgi:hypothetical protein
MAALPAIVLATQLLVQAEAAVPMVAPRAAAVPPLHGGRCAYCGGTDRACVRCGDPLLEGTAV